MLPRRDTRKVKASGLVIGGGAPISVQSMCNTDTRDADETLAQIRRLKEAGCELVRLAVPDGQAADALGRIARQAGLPVCADIHFDYRLAIRAIEAGVAKVRINPGNIGSDEKAGEVAKAASERGIPIRIGVNSGSISASLISKYGRTAKALAESALSELATFERLGFYDNVVSVKSSDVIDTVEANRYISSRVRYPLHLGVTEAGPPDTGLVRSAAAMGALLMEGIGDTIRISLTADPVTEVIAGSELLVSLGLRKGLRIISCPTCGRSRGDVAALLSEVRRGLAGKSLVATVAVMGCEVNGPGEAAGADYAIACGLNQASIFKAGQVVARVPLGRASAELLELISKAVPGADEE